MTTKEKILLLLSQNAGTMYSGQMIAEQLQISRTAIWKAMKSLREEGYQIESAPNAGYTLIEKADILNEVLIQQKLKKQLNVSVLPTVDSTNEEAKRLMNNGKNEDSLVIADQQTKGKGRLGRTFYSPKQTGLYMSLGINEMREDADPTLITTAAAVAVCRAIEKLTNLQPQIKWVNDLYLNEKKVCGILTEGIINMETQTIQSIVLGIGINVMIEPEELPSELQNVAGALFEETPSVTRNDLAAAILNEFYELYQNMHTKEFLEDYRKRCFVIGRRVSFIRNKVSYEGLAVAVDDQGALVIQVNDGTTTHLSYGEISIRLEEKNA